MCAVCLIKRNSHIPSDFRSCFNSVIHASWTRVQQHCSLVCAALCLFLSVLQIHKLNRDAAAFVFKGALHHFVNLKK